MFRSGRAISALLLCALANGATSAARTVPDEHGASLVPPVEEALPPISAPPGARRPLPAYDGRSPPPPSAKEAFAWAPRLVLLPAHLAVEHVLRRPGRAAIEWAEERKLWTRVYDAFTWDEGRGGVYPIFSLDLGLKSTLGATLFDDRWILDSNRLRVSASFADDGVLDTNLRDQLSLFREGSGRLVLRSHYARRPDGVFYGIGDDTRDEDKTFYSFEARGVGLALEGDLGGLNRATLGLSFRGQRFARSRIDSGTPDLRDRYGGPGQPALPPGLSGYELLEPGVRLTLDSRDRHADSAPGSGVRLEGELAYAVDPTETDLRFASWGVTADAFYDHSRVGHVLGLELAARFVEPLGDRPVPFTELPSLGGLEWMRGFLRGRLRDESAVVATVQYRYPFWIHLDGEIFSGLGGVFPGRLRGLAADRLFASYGIGLRTVASRETALAFTLAFGSNRLGSGRFDPLATTRVSLGVNHGF